ncbi:MAG: FAD-dependent oxidoreductase [Rhodobacteraceae bacterium]|nr:FAD-dependent oxidoreductase [Paracoccaceae bacterium]
MANITVIGAGVYGLSCALALLKDGHGVRVLEKGRVGQGASGGLVGALSPHVPEDWNIRKQFQLGALVSADEHWSEVEALSGLPSGYGRVGRYIPLDDAYEAEKAQGRCAGAMRLWSSRFSWQVLANAAHIAKEAAPFGVVHETLSARIHPRLASAALAAAVLKNGGEIVENHAVHTLEGVSVIAAGIGSEALLSPFLGEGKVRGVKGQAALLSGGLPAGSPVIYGNGVYIIPHADGTVAVGATSENKFTEAHRTDALLDAVLAKAIAIVPALSAAKVMERHAGLRPRAPKPEAMLGQLDDHTFVATGGFKTGLGNAHVIAKALVQLVRGEAPDIPKDLSPKHHLTKRVKQPMPWQIADRA